MYTAELNVVCFRVSKLRILEVKQVAVPEGSMWTSHRHALCKVSLQKMSVVISPQLRRLVAGFPPQRPGFKPGSGHGDFVMDKSGAGADFLRELRFPLPTYIPSVSPQSSLLSPETGTIGQE
jgi:hypothetical protein